MGDAMLRIAENGWSRRCSIHYNTNLEFCTISSLLLSRFCHKDIPPKSVYLLGGISNWLRPFLLTSLLPVPLNTDYGSEGLS